MSNSHADLENSREETVTAPDGVVHRVRAVKRGMWLRGDVEAGPATSLEELVFKFVADMAILLATSMRASSQNVWKVGVFRQGRAKVERLVHKEVLPPNVAPETRMSELSEFIRTGRSDQLRR